MGTNDPGAEAAALLLEGLYELEAAGSISRTWRVLA